MLSGVLVVDKPSGMTSHDVVAQARRLYGQRQVGHAGTLDPMATGVLVVLFGEATKLSPYLSGADKSYRAVIRFGMSTDTLDADGRPTATQRVMPGELSEARVRAALDLERARGEQEPPLVSALKIGGTAAHRLARRGQTVELAPRRVRVHALELVERGEDWIFVELTVSKGYYVRALARDLGERLAVPTHLAELRRTASGAFSLAEATTWPAASRPALLAPGAAAARTMPSATLRPESIQRARQGKLLSGSDFVTAAPSNPSAWLDEQGRIVAVGVGEGENYRVLRGFSEP